MKHTQNLQSFGHSAAGTRGSDAFEGIRGIMCGIMRRSRIDFGLHFDLFRIIRCIMRRSGGSMLKSVGFEHTSPVEIDDALCFCMPRGGPKRGGAAQDRYPLGPRENCSLAPKVMNKCCFLCVLAIC